MRTRTAFSLAAFYSLLAFACAPTPRDASDGIGKASGGTAGGAAGGSGATGGSFAGNSGLWAGTGGTAQPKGSGGMNAGGSGGMNAGGSGGMNAGGAAGMNAGGAAGMNAVGAAGMNAVGAAGMNAGGGAGMNAGGMGGMNVGGMGGMNAAGSAGMNVGGMGGMNAAGTARGTTCDIGAEGDAVDLACPAGQVIKQVTFASFGTVTGTCPTLSAGTCDAAGSVTVVKDRYVGKNACSIFVGIGEFGDPCDLVSKKLGVLATCGI